MTAQYEISISSPAGPLLVVVSGPAGVGKDSLLRELRARGTAPHFVVTCTTRAPRPGEVDGVDYFFVSEPRFQEMIAAGELLEWAKVYGDYKGVPKSSIEYWLLVSPAIVALPPEKPSDSTMIGGLPSPRSEQIVAGRENGLDLIMRVDVQGAASIRKLVPDAVLIFLAPSSLEELERRLRERNSTESPEELALRLATARHEMAQLPLFDYAVINHEGKLDEAAAAVEAILLAERCRTNRRPVRL